MPLTGCGGGGGVEAPQAPVAGSSIVIETAGAATTLYGVEFTLQLPPGVTLATPGGGTLAAGVMVPSGGAAGADAGLSVFYDTGAAPQTVKVSLVKPSGFPVGRFLSVTLVLAQGTTLVPAAFVISGFKAWDDLASYRVNPLITSVVAAP
ncbi:lipoprotein [Geoanaerobacter pelophilus]|uniref:Lipoprotein n=1 Tax=Geoanaerobacter pelophilus TaxID=60036 RepID=A0ABQ0MGT9_9BACT|nr:lipoprotein [Geoanaerobacter pelophilus]